MENQELDLNEVIVDTAVHLELYKEYITEELKNNKENFQLFSEWREVNKELLS